MGTRSIEERAAKSARRAQIGRALLLALYGGTAISLAILAPNAARIIKYMDPLFEEKRDPRGRMREALLRLQRKGLVRNVNGRYLITEAGSRKISLMEAGSVGRRKKDRPWDGKWRIIMFDVWERRKSVRERLRHLLIGAGFVRLQDSVWVTPYPAEELCELVRSELKVGSGMRYVLAEAIDNEASLKRLFKL